MFSVEIVTSQGTLKGLWINLDPSEQPDVAVYYAHGMLSSTGNKSRS
jgi:hypothetical protein